MSHITIGAAYGRSYTSKAGIMEDWNSDRDFRDLSWDATGTYINRQQVSGRERIEARYGKQGEKVCTFVNGDKTPPKRVNGPKKERPLYRVWKQKERDGAGLEQCFSNKAKALKHARQYSRDFGYYLTSVHVEVGGVLTLLKKHGGR